ncbi:hypothetical protein Tco_0920322 [Tanacetum coccineum]
MKAGEGNKREKVECGLSQWAGSVGPSWGSHPVFLYSTPCDSFLFGASQQCFCVFPRSISRLGLRVPQMASESLRHVTRVSPSTHQLLWSTYLA